jgi:diguanylate cyclase (GGDEF)-like protein
MAGRLTGGALAALRSPCRSSLCRGRDRQAGFRLLSRQDALTGVGNYRELHESLALQVGRHALTRMRFALVLVDLDEFKSINDEHGHLEGDRVLREVGSLLGDAVRRRDIVARRGGDEFSVIAPETSEGEASELATRLEQAVSRLMTPDRPLSACTGWAVYPDDGETPDDLIGHADQALRQEKRTRQALATGKAPKVVASDR